MIQTLDQSMNVRIRTLVSAQAASMYNTRVEDFELVLFALNHLA